MLYTQESAAKLSGLLREQGYHPTIDADLLINKKIHFPRLMNASRKQVEPSLVNHIGFYSSHNSPKAEARANFDQLNTDVRVLFDYGEYEHQEEPRTQHLRSEGERKT